MARRHYAERKAAKLHIDDNAKCDAWYEEHCKFIKSNIAGSPRGEFYWHASTYDNEIYAIGCEQGNYAGGDLVSMSYGHIAGIRQELDKLATCKPDTFEYDLWLKIKDLPIISIAAYNKMVQEWQNLPIKHYRCMYLRPIENRQETEEEQRLRYHA